MCAMVDTSECFVDTTYEYYMENWFTQMGLQCVSPGLIAALVSCFSIGFSVSVFLSTLPDKIGR